MWVKYKTKMINNHQKNRLNINRKKFHLNSFCNTNLNAKDDQRFYRKRDRIRGLLKI